MPREWWRRVVVLAFFNIAGWNGFVLFGVQQLPAGRSAIIAYTMPIWATLIAMRVLHEPLYRRKIVGLVLGMLGMVVLLGDDIRHIRSTPIGAILILCAAILWAVGTVLLRKWKPPIPQNTLSGWMMLLGWLPLAIAAPFFETHPCVVPRAPVRRRVVRDPLQHLPRRHARALGVVHARAHAAGGGVVAVVAARARRRRVRRDDRSSASARAPRSSWRSALVIASLFAVLWRAAGTKTSRAADAAEPGRS